MKKIFTLLSALFLSVTAAMATTFTFTSEASVSQTADGYTVTLSKGSGNNAPAFFKDYDPVQMRLYANNTITISGANITSIELTFAKNNNKEYASLTASTGNLVSGGASASNTDFKTDKWTGSASSVTFTLGTGQRIISSIIVNNDGTETPGTPGTPSDPGTPDTPSELDPDFDYPEPTQITVPSTTVQGDAYSFIRNNVLVSSTKGAITANYFSAHAGYDLTFTAARPIKGIVINGFVKKDFEATVNHGQVSYLTPAEDTEANPVMVITDVNSTTVTISCVKQLRCYNVEVYFDANPDATVSGGSSGGEEITLVFDGAEAVYESEYSELIEEENYSIFLFYDYDYSPYFALDLYPAQKDVLTGKYSMADYSLGEFTYYVFGENEEDFTWAVDGEVTVTKNGDIYSIEGTLLCDDGNLYLISFSGEMPIYIDKDYYDDGDDDDGTGGVDEIVSPELSADGQAYDLNGHRVGRNYRGIFVRNGKKYVGR